MTDAAAAFRLHVDLRSGGSAAPRVVLVHGSMDTSASFRELDGLLPDLDVARYDRRGYGRSRAPAVPFDRHVDDLVDVLDGHPAVLFGHSLGGAVVLAAAVRVPQLVKAALVYEVPMPWLAWWPPVLVPDRAADEDEIVRTAELFLRRHLGDAGWEGLPAGARADLIEAAPAWAAELRSAGERAPFEPEDVAVPVVSVYGTATDERHRAAATLLADRIPRARLARIPGADHRAHRRHPAELAALLRTLSDPRS